MFALSDPNITGLPQGEHPDILADLLQYHKPRVHLLDYSVEYLIEYSSIRQGK